MSANSSFLGTEAFTGYLSQAQAHLPSTSRLLLLSLVNIPVIIILLNITLQFVSPKDLSKPPIAFYWLPWIGSAIEYGTDPVKFFTKCRQKYGNVFTFILFGRRMVVCLGSKGNNFVTNAKTSHISAEEAYTHLTTPVFGRGVVYDVPNEVLMEQKKFVKFGLSADNLRAYVGMIEDEVVDFMNKDSAFKIYQMNDINEWGSFNSFKTTAEITILTAARTLQGEEVRASMDKNFAALYADLDAGFTPINFMFPNLPLESYRKRDRAQQAMSDFYVDILSKRKNGSHDYDMIASLMQQKYRNGRALEDREIAHIMIALLMAGQHTSSATSAWILLHLADNPEICEALYEEQVKHFGTGVGSFRSATSEEIKSLPLLNAVIRESLRLHPPLHTLMRKVINDIDVPPTLSAPSKDNIYVIPKGYFVVMSPLMSQIDPEIWRDAETWDPYRWLDNNGFAAQALENENKEEMVDYGWGAISKGTNSPYQPFGAGRHRCIGEQFAYLQLGTIVSAIVQKLELRLDGDFPKHNYQTMVTTPKAPCEIRYRRRNFD